MGRPDKVCINIAGDGCFRMNMNELATASRYQIPIIEVVINNHVLGMVRQWQTLFYEKRYSQTVLNDGVDFCMVAKGLGCEAIRITRKEEVADALRRAIELKRPVLIACIIPEDDKVFPMDILPEFLIKSIIANDIDRMEQLGIYEVAPEDFSLCEFVCSSKMELQKIVREGLDRLRKEMC